MAGAIDHNLRKFHASLNVTDLERSIAFYRVLLGTEPAKVRPDYAKFDLAEPPLVLSLIPGSAAGGGNLNHVGLRVRTAEELVEIQHRLEAAGLHTEREEGVECCYARQTKFWITDPDRALWEIYVFHEDIEEPGHTVAVRVAAVDAATTTAAAASWEHRLRDPIPAEVPHDDNSLHTVRLEGSLNLPSGDRVRLLKECLRALRPGAAIHLHGLSGDRASNSPPALPGPAAVVQEVPATDTLVDEMARIGFAGIQIEKLSQTPCFVVDGVSMREIRIVARKPGFRPKSATQYAIYLGPLNQVADDFGNVFRRGVLTALNRHDWEALSASSAASSFLFPKAEEVTAAGCCDTRSAEAAGVA